MISAEEFTDEPFIDWEELPPPASPRELLSIAQAVPELKYDVEALLLWGGHVEESTLPSLDYTFLKDHNLLALLEVGSATHHPDDIFAAVCGYVIRGRHKQQLESFDDLYNRLDSPELHTILGLLQAERDDERHEAIDKLGLLAAEAALKQQLMQRYGLTGHELESGINVRATNEFRLARHRLNENPPFKAAPDRNTADDWSRRQFAAIEYMLPRLTTMVNSLGHGCLSDPDGQDEDIFINNNVSGLRLAGWWISDEDEDYADPLLMTEVTLANGRTEVVDLSSLLNAIEGNYRYAKDPSINLTDLVAISSLVWSDSVETFKKSFAFEFHNMRTGLSLADYPDSSVYQYSLIDLMIENLILRGATVKHSFRPVDMSGKRTNPSLAAEGRSQNEWLMVHNNPDHIPGYIGEVTYLTPPKATQASRMVVFDGPLIVPGDHLETAENYDLALNISLSTGDNLLLPNIPGYKIVAYKQVLRLADDKLAYRIGYAHDDHDPYQVPEITINERRLDAFCRRLDRMGLNDCASDLRSLAQPVLKDVLNCLSYHSFYGTGQKPLRGKVAILEHLAPFVENDQLVGTCTVFAAATKFALDYLVSDSQPRMLGGHSIHPGNRVKAEGHAQVAFMYGGKPYVTEYQAGATEKAKPVDEFAPRIAYMDELSDDEQIVRRVLSLKSSLTAMLCRKYGIDIRNRSELMRQLAKKRPEHIGRRVMSICLRMEQFSKGENNETPQSVSDQIAQTYQLLDDWRQRGQSLVLKQPRLSHTFGNWSPEEIEELKGGLHQIKELLVATLD